MQKVQFSYSEFELFFTLGFGEFFKDFEAYIHWNKCIDKQFVENKISLKIA